jgi:hypothetical protein
MVDGCAALNKYALPYVEILGMGSRRSEVVQLILE